MINGELYNEAKTLKLLAEGNELAFTQLFDRYRPRVYGVAMNLLKSPTLAEEVVQDVFLKVWQKRERLAHVEKIEGYLFTMARNNIFDQFKKKANDAEVRQAFKIKPDSIDNADHQLIEKEYTEILESCIERLTPQQREIYKLAREQHLSHEEIAKLLNISKLTVKTHMANALKSIRKNLERNAELYTFLPLIITILSK